MAVTSEDQEFGRAAAAALNEAFHHDVRSCSLRTGIHSIHCRMAVALAFEALPEESREGDPRPILGLLRAAYDLGPIALCDVHDAPLVAA